MRVLTISAADVRVGDYLFNNSATHPAFQWCRVVRVEPTTVPRSFDPKDGSYEAVEISTSGWSTYKHKLEGVTVRRFQGVESDSSRRTLPVLPLPA